MNEGSVKKKPTSHAWATNGWAWQEFFKYIWFGTLTRSTKDYFDLWLNRDAYIARYYSSDEIVRRTKALS